WHVLPGVGHHGPRPADPGHRAVPGLLVVSVRRGDRGRLGQPHRRPALLIIGGPSATRPAGHPTTCGTSGGPLSPAPRPATTRGEQCAEAPPGQRSDRAAARYGDGRLAGW